MRLTTRTAPAAIVTAMLLLLVTPGCSNEEATKADADTKTTPAGSAGMFAGRTVALEPQSVAPGSDTLVLTVDPPIGYKFTPDAPSQLTFYSGNEAVVSFGGDSTGFRTTAATYPLQLPYTAAPGQAMVTVDATIFFCRKGSTICVFDKVHIEIPVTVDRGGAQKLAVHIEAEGPDDAL